MVAKEKYHKGRKNIPVAGFTFPYEAWHIEEIRKCAQDIIYFAEKYFYIVQEVDNEEDNTSSAKRELITLFPKQKEIFKNFKECKYNIVLASRQTSKTTLMTIYCLWLALFKDDQTICYGANKESTAKQILKRVKMAYEELPVWLKAPASEWNEKSVSFDNGSQIITGTTSGDSFRGYSVTLLCLDEFAFVPLDVANEFYNSVIPTICSFKSSKIIMVSTPNGAQGIFYEIYTKSLLDAQKTPEVGVEYWKNSTMLWSDFPGRDETWRKNALNAINGDELRFAQEYGCQFLQIGSSAIDTHMIELYKNITKSIRPVSIEFGSYFRIYVPYNPKHTYIVGVDVSAGIGADYHCIQILDITDLTKIEQVAVFNSNGVPINVFTNYLFTILTNWGNPYVLIEANNHGQGVLALLENLYNYDKIVNYKKPSHTAMPDFLSEKGIDSKHYTKNNALNNFKYYFEYIKVVKLNDLSTVIELEQFRKNGNDTYSASRNHSDDRVCALLWALYILERDLAEHYLNVAAYDENGKVMSIIHKENNSLLSNFFFEQRVVSNPIYTNSDVTGIKHYEKQGWTFT